MIEEKKIQIKEYDYLLPEEKIAFFPAAQRDQSKLLVYHNHTITDDCFCNLANHLSPDTLLIFNNSKVIHARLQVVSSTGSHIEIFCLEPLFPTTELSQAFTQTGMVIWKCMVGNAKRWKHPLTLQTVINQKKIIITAEKGENKEGTFEVTFRWDSPEVTFAEWIEVYGKMPLPPYIKRDAEKEDESRYQTVYAKHDGSVAAPTAGLHFSEAVFDQLRKKGIDIDYITLHVGAGTFKPVSTDCIGDHFMHQEKIIITLELIDKLLYSHHKQVVAIGTTVARTLESLFVMGAKLKVGKDNPFQVEQWEVYEDQALMEVTAEEALLSIKKYLQEQHTDTLSAATQMIILPGYKHKITNGLLTNFHQPKSTLLLLIASYLGDEWKNIYQHALSHDYRFLSFGDSNLYLL